MAANVDAVTVGDLSHFLRRFRWTDARARALLLASSPALSGLCSVRADVFGRASKGHDP
jgi:hypothetical protein